MDCKHNRLRTVGDRVFCCECREELPIEFLYSRSAPAKADNGAEKAAADGKQDKPAPRKRTSKKAV